MILYQENFLSGDADRPEFYKVWLEIAAVFMRLKMPCENFIIF